MPDASTLEGLALRVEAASEDETASLLIEAFDLTNWRCKRQGSLVSYNPEWFAFDKLIRAKGFLDAALSLVPSGWVCGFESGKAPVGWAYLPTLAHHRGTKASASAATPALALTAAALRALASIAREGGSDE